MTMHSPLPHRVFCCAAALMLVLPLASCMRWHTADRLRDAHTTYTGADIYHPVDGMLHSRADGKGRVTRYVVAPEVTYRHRSHLINANGFNWYHDSAYARELQPTGRTLVVELGNYRFKRVVPNLPQGLNAEPVPPPEKRNFWNEPGWRAGDTHAEALGSLSCREEAPSAARRALIGTCDYVVDPLLSIITMPVELGCWIVGAPLAAGVGGFLSLLPGDEEDAKATLEH